MKRRRVPQQMKRKMTRIARQTLHYIILGLGIFVCGLSFSATANACDWKVELRNNLAGNSTFFTPSKTGIYIPLKMPASGLDAQCTAQVSINTEDPTAKANGSYLKTLVVVCGFTDKQGFESIGSAVIYSQTGKSIAVLPVILHFFGTKTINTGGTDLISSTATLLGTCE